MRWRTYRQVAAVRVERQTVQAVLRRSHLQVARLAQQAAQQAATLVLTEIKSRQVSQTLEQVRSVAVVVTEV
jgi:hypothetical protein